MFRRTLAAATIGSALGAVLGILAAGLGTARVLDAGLTVPVRDDGVIVASFAVGQAWLYLYTLVAGAVGGAILGMVGYAVGGHLDPGARRYRLGPIAVLGAAIGAPTAFAAARALAGLGADIVAGTVVVSTFRAGVVAAGAGAITGMLVVVAADRLSRPATIGLAGAAVPATPRQFVRDALAAVGLPAIGVGAAGLAVFGLSRVLLESDKTTALVVFSGVAAAVLFGTAFIASRPPRRR